MVFPHPGSRLIVVNLLDGTIAEHLYQTEACDALPSGGHEVKGRLFQSTADFQYKCEGLK